MIDIAEHYSFQIFQGALPELHSEFKNPYLGLCPWAAKTFVVKGRELSIARKSFKGFLL